MRIKKEMAKLISDFGDREFAANYAGRASLPILSTRLSLYRGVSPV